jgi:hypothetical protein
VRAFNLPRRNAGDLNSVDIFRWRSDAAREVFDAPSNSIRVVFKTDQDS